MYCFYLYICTIIINQKLKSMKKGIKVTHKLTGETLTVKNINGNIVTCYIEKPYTIFTNILVDICICKKSNLILM